MAQPSVELMKDVTDAVDKIIKLQKQISQPDRNGMIKALQDAKASAFFQISTVEVLQGDTIIMPPDDFTDEDLYRKLPQYQQGLEAYCIEKVGTKVYNQIFAERSTLQDKNK